MPDVVAHGPAASGWSTAGRTAAALAAAMGVGRFVFTPVLPLMEQQAHLVPGQASLVASANYLGYLAGAVLGIAVPWVSRARLAFRTAGAALIGSLLLMPLTTDLIAWIVIRGVAGLASAVVFMVAGNTILSELAGRSPQLVGWAYGGVGAGIAASGLLIAAVGAIGDWRTAWFWAAGLAGLLLAVGWSIGQPSGAGAGFGPEPLPDTASRPQRWFVALAVSYFLEGAGYIIAGTFLVAAVRETGPSWLAAGVWTIVGAAAIPSCAAWSWLSTRISRPTLITAALILQAVGIAIPAVAAAAPAVVVSAGLFGATFVAITTLSLATGRHLRVARAVAVLTAGYGVGQVLGPILVAPTLGGGYRVALEVAAALVLLAALASALLRVRFPHRDQPHHRQHRTVYSTAAR